MARLLPTLLIAYLSVAGSFAFGIPSSNTEEAVSASSVALEPPSGSQPAIGLKADPAQMVELPAHPVRVLKLDLTRNPIDIWDRIRRGFAIPDLDSALVAKKQSFYLTQPGFLKQVFERGSRYLYHIVAELERRGMPTELALLPMVESSYNPLAYSRSGAAGLWQFIPSTGKNYKLTQDKWVDERRDVIASTSAALDYLQTLYEMHGDWHLALASYNWGEGAVGRALRRNLDAGLPAEYSHLRMPAEPRNYIPKLQALKNIVARPELFDIELPHVLNHRNFVAVEAPRGIDLATAASFASMPVREFIALNPGYNRPVIITGGQSLIVPVDQLESFTTQLNAATKQGKRWKTYQLKRGEDIAAVARRSGMSVAHLREINSLSAHGRVPAGHTLIVPDGIDHAGALEAAREIRRSSRK